MLWRQRATRSVPRDRRRGRQCRRCPLKWVWHRAQEAKACRRLWRRVHQLGRALGPEEHGLRAGTTSHQVCKLVRSLSKEGATSHLRLVREVAGIHQVEHRHRSRVRVADFPMVGDLQEVADILEEEEDLLEAVDLLEAAELLEAGELLTDKDPLVTALTWEPYSKE